MTDNVLPFAADPYGTWTEGILALCEAMADCHRLPSALRRLERTAERINLTTEDLCILALVSPVPAPEEPPKPEITEQRVTAAEHEAIPDADGLLAQALAAIEAVRVARQEREDATKDAFGPDDPRRILTSTIWGVLAVALVDASDRLGSRDPYRRLAVRLGLWFQPSSASQWMGIATGEVGGIRDLLRRLVARIPPHGDGSGASVRLLRIVAGIDTVAHTSEGLADLHEIVVDLDQAQGLGEQNAGPAAMVLAESLMLAATEAVAWEKSILAGIPTVHTAVSLLNRTNKAGDFLGCTWSLPAWLRQDRRSMLMPDLPWFLPDLAFHKDEWPKDRAPIWLEALVEFVGRQGLAAFPQGPFPLTFHGGWAPERGLPARLAKPFPEAHDLLRLLSLCDGDWAEDGGEFGPGFWGDPPGFRDDPPYADDDTVDLRAACERALGRGDPALADMLIGCWLMYMFLSTQRALPHVSDIARVVRRIPAEDRVSVDAVLGLLTTDLASDPDAVRRLAHLLSYLPPVTALAPSDPEAELRAHLGDERWGWLSSEARKALVQNEVLFRDLRQIGETAANARGPAKLLPHMAAVFEPVLRRALRRCDPALANVVTDRMPLGELLQNARRAWDLAANWPAGDARRQHLIGGAWLEMLEDLNRANIRSGKHLAGAANGVPAWGDVAALRSRVILGGALRECLRAAGPPTPA